MKFIDKHYTQTLEVKQSKFISHLIPYSQYNETLKKLRKEHTKARHFVVAYRYLNEFKQIVEYSSDDGEPKGTSGKPSLIVLQGNQMINTAVIVVRYFGGTKLGTGGLVRAYSDAVNLVLKSSVLYEYKEKVIRTISFDYARIRQVEYDCLEHNIEILEKKFDLEMTYLLQSDEVCMLKFLKILGRLVKVI